MFESIVVAFRSIMGDYSPIVLSDVSGVQPGEVLAFVDWSYIFACIAFLILLYSSIRIFASALDRR